MSSKVANRFADLVARGSVDFSVDTFKIALMDRDFTFNRVTHEAYADISASELPTLYGYTTGGLALAGVALTQNNTLNALIVSWNNAAWTATGGDLESGGAIIYDDTLAAPVAKPIVGFIDFSGALLVLNGGVFTIANITFVMRAIDS